ncbi:MAG: hypothetical protein ACE5EE_07320, partial [Fidelibacterota bacterium]
MKSGELELTPRMSARPCLHFITVDPHKRWPANPPSGRKQASGRAGRLTGTKYLSSSSVIFAYYHNIQW